MEGLHQRDALVLTKKGNRIAAAYFLQNPYCGFLLFINDVSLCFNCCINL